MNELVFAAPAYARLSEQVLRDERETCATLYTQPVAAGGRVRHLVRDVEIVPEDAYIERSAISAQLSPAYVLAVANRARRERVGIVLAHTHPKAVGAPRFSLTDDDGETLLAPFLSARAVDQPHLALVIGREGCRCRKLGASDEYRVTEVGAKLNVLFEPNPTRSTEARFDRQVRAFGAAGQARVRQLAVAIVGLGGTGSLTAQCLAYLGVSRFVLIDPDKVEPHNLNRLVGASPKDIGAAKTDVAAHHIRHINPAASVRAIRGDVVDQDVASALPGVDFIFCCTDSHASRAVLTQLAYQYLIACIDMGVSITTKNGAITHVTGRVQMLAPGLACLTCTNALDANVIREEMMSPEQRQADPYFNGFGAPQPAVISLNGTVASLAMTMFLSAVAGIPAAPRFQIYDGLRGTVRPMVADPVTNCIVCSSSGALAHGDAWPLPTRRPK